MTDLDQTGLPTDWREAALWHADTVERMRRVGWRPPPSDDAYDATAILIAEAINANAPVDWMGLRLRQYSAIWANAARQKLADAGLLATPEDDGCGWKQRYEALRNETLRDVCDCTEEPHERGSQQCVHPSEPLEGPSDLDPQTGFPLHRREHRYLSTACLHGEHGYCQSVTGLSGSKHPAQCKWCDAPCVCGCHEEVSGT